MAQHYAIRDLDQAKQSLADSILGPRLRGVIKLMIDQKGGPLLKYLALPMT
jgi:uncharacterized protein (DUF1810 family)